MDETTFSKNFAFMRKKLNLTQRQIATRMDVSPRTVCNWENGKRTPRLPHLIIIASTIFCISLDALVETIIEVSNE